MDDGTETAGVIVGAPALAKFIFDDERKARSVYHLVDTTDIPIFYLGSNLAGRDVRLLDWLEKQKRASRAPKEEPAAA